MRTFWPTKQSTTSRTTNFKLINIVFIFLLIGTFAVIAFYNKITLFLVQKDKIDLFADNLQSIAFYFLPIDKEISHFLVLVDDTMKSYRKGDNVLITKEKEIDQIREYAKKNSHYLTSLGFANYTPIFTMVSDLREYRDELFNLLGKNKEYNYLVILQNTNEKRPNGGFFGSFAFITVKGGHIINLEIVDAYYPDFIAYRTRILAPEWTSSFLPDRKIGFIAGNKFGFTDIDGKNLKDLYEKMFNETYDMEKVKKTMQPALYEKLLHKNIKGVIFIRSDLIEKIIPNFTNTIWEWQFLNASVDLLRGEIRGNKKEEYIKAVKDFFAKNSFHLFKSVINNFDWISKEKGINMYLSNISTGFQQALIKNNLTNIFQTGNIYDRDTNVSFDKVDAFMTKTIQIQDERGSAVIESSNDIVNISRLSPGKYVMEILYSLNVPEYYMTFIQSLEKKYTIKLTDREKGILAIQPSIYDDVKYGKVLKRRESKSTLYLPKNITILNVEGDIYYYEKFSAPFANGLFYQMGINTNMTSKKIRINIEIK